MKEVIFLLYIALFLMFIFSCKNNPAGIEKTGNIKGKVTNSSDGNSIPGVNITTNPTTSSVSTNSSGDYEITGVNPGSYTVSASKIGYKLNTVIVSVNENSTATANIQLSVPITVTDIDGNVYQTIKIGDQLWMSENLKVTHYRNGDPIPHVTSNVDWIYLTTGAYCAYNNDNNNVDTYGLLYNWYAVNDSYNIAPEGWHVPTEEEWKQLAMDLGMSQSEADDYGWLGTDEGDKLKHTEGWYSNGNGTNESGFTALPGGCRGPYTGNSEDIGEWGFWWSTSNYGWTTTRSWVLSYDKSHVGRSLSAKTNGYSVRLVRD